MQLHPELLRATQQRQAILRENEDAAEAILTSEAMQRLAQNPDFIKVIDEAYLEHESNRLIGLLADGSAMPERDEQDMIKQMYGISYLRAFLGKLLNIKSLAESKLESNVQELQDIDAEIDALNAELNSGGEV